MNARHVISPIARKGYSRRADVPSQLLRRLNAGLEETVTLAEWLAVDSRALARALVRTLGIPEWGPPLLEAAGIPRVMERQRRIGATLHALLAARGDRAALFDTLASHRSDVVREWAALVLAADTSLTLDGRLAALRRFAADPNPNVREIAWVAFRPYVETDLTTGVRLLRAWTEDEDPRIRRCAIEGTRPRVVWCTHIRELKENPGLALPLLEAVRADEDRYVQLSVGNWLNDAAKSQPEWVTLLCRRWRRESRGPATRFIVQRALRSLRPGVRRAPASSRATARDR